MTFPSSIGTQAFSLNAALALAQGTAGGIKQRAQIISAACGAGPVAANTILDFITFLANANQNLTQCAAVPGLAAYAQAQVGDANIASEFVTMQTALNAVTTWVLANFPRDSTNTFLLITLFTSDNSGRTQQQQFSITQTAGFKAMVDALVATIN